MLTNARVPILGIAAWSGTGKTTLLTRVLPMLVQRGVRTGMIKHAHHTFDVDHPGKDSHSLRKAGASRIVVASRRRWALMVEEERAPDPDLDHLLGQLGQDHLDLVLVEGFKHERFPKIEIHRPSLGRPLLFPDDPTVIAVATDAPLDQATQLPMLDLNRPEEITQFIMEFIERWQPIPEGRAVPA
jgi:molybdopterin-guanine dinucleotide biosynthesis protein B